MAMHISGPVYVSDGRVESSEGNYVTVPMPKQGGTYAAASGTVLAAWQTRLPPFALQLKTLALTHAGATAGPQGGNLIVKVWSNGARKGLVTLGVGGGTQRTLVSGELSFTFPASALVGVTMHTVGATAAGGGGQPTLYMRHWS